jgi:hypothetical protein
MSHTWQGGQAHGGVLARKAVQGNGRPALHHHHGPIRPRHEIRRSLGWIAPELKTSTLTLTDDHIAGPRPSRTWAGMVDGPTFERFARAWRLPGQITTTTPPVTDDPDRVARTYTLDGMNWEAGGISPIVCVSVQVTRPPRARSQAAYVTQT